MKRASLFLLALFGFAIILTSCGGGGGGGTTPPRVNLTVTSTTVPYGEANVPYPGTQLTATGGTPPYTWSSTNLPYGLSLSSDGMLTGTSNFASTYTFGVYIKDSANHTGVGSITLNIYNPMMFYVDSREVSSTAAYNGAIHANTNDASINATIKITSGDLPPGLTLGTPVTTGPDPHIPLNGTPTQGGVYSFVVEATDSLTPPRTEHGTVKIFVDVTELRFTASSALWNAKRGEAYQQTLWTTGGLQPLTCSVVSGSLPAGLNVGAGCIVSGTPTEIGEFNFTARATDSGVNTNQQSVDQAFSLKVLEPLKVDTNLPDAVTGEIYSATPNISGGTPPYYIQSFDAYSCCFVLERHDMTIRGVPHRPGRQPLYLYVSDSAGQSVSMNLYMNVAEGPFELGTNGLPRAKANHDYSGALSAVSGTSPLTWAITDGALPPGMTMSSFDSNLTLGGTLQGAGDYSATVTVTDSATPAKTLTVPLNFHVTDKLPRNDSVASADFLSTNGYYVYVGRSISPYADPNDVANPDNDYYHLRAFAGETVQVSVANSSSTMDPVLEIVDANGQRFSTCRDPGDDVSGVSGTLDQTPLAFDDSCMNDDQYPGDLRSKLMFRVPGASGTQVDYYVHVLDWRGDARPDMQYTITLTQYLSLID